MSTEPVWTTRPEHLSRIFREQNAVKVQPANITTGQRDIPGLEGVAITVNGAARIVLPVAHAWKLSDQLVDVLEQLREQDDGDQDGDG